MNILAIIPARGGSKGIPRKNLRSLMGKPLIYYVINTALSSKFNIDVYVSSEDEEILNISEQIGAKTFKRPSDLSQDQTTLDPVIYNAYKSIEEKEAKKYDIILTLQVTSPLLTVNTLDSAIARFIEKKDADTMISVINDTHLSWRLENGKYLPNYEERLNRQYLPQQFKETGAFLMSRSTIISENGRIGDTVELFEMPDKESIDIDTHADWNICEYYLRQRKILLVLGGNNAIGMGHVYNCLIVANGILNHEVEFLVTKDSQLAFDKISVNNYKVKIQETESILEEINLINPDIVINDLLDTEKSYVESLKKSGKVVINFEDLGGGAELADLVFNALYPEKNKIENHFFGGKYFIARDEFLLSEVKEPQEKVNSILITYGGVDPNNLTLKTIQAIYEYCVENDIELNVIAGKGYAKYDTLTKFDKIKVHRDVKNMSQYMNEADLIFSSAGRTIYEIALMGTPAIIMGQNDREMTHFFASEKYGFLNLGLGIETSENQIFESFKELLSDQNLRLEMRNKMLAIDIRNGRNEVLRLINQTIEEKCY